MACGNFSALVLQGVMLSLGTLALTRSAVFAAPQDIAEEPPAQYTLTVNGKAVPLVLDQETRISVRRAGRTRVKLSRKPTRTFDKFGVRFDYPAAFTFEADTSEPDIVNWVVAGTRSSVTLQRSPRNVPALLLNFTTWQMIREYGAKNSKTTPISRVLGGKKVSGNRIDFTIGSSKMMQEVFAFSHVRSSFILIYQDELSDAGKPSAEGSQLKKLISSSFSLS